MPRLSIIVPHVSNDVALETTLLSVLENRPANVEIIVAHSGDYADPYGLDDDEVRIVSDSTNREPISLLNAALEYATAPIVQTLLPGCRVTHDWTVSALAWFHDAKIGSVGAVGEIEDSHHGEFAGLDIRCLPRRMRFSKAKRGDEAGTSLSGGFFRRSAMESLGGWMNGASREGAEVEAALALQALGLKSIVEPASRVCGSREVIEGETGGYANGHYSAQLAVAYSHTTGINFVQDSLAARIGHLAGGLIQPSSVAERLGWVLGLSDRSLVAPVKNRIDAAKKLMATRSVESIATMRRAA